jgi:hypothetical protein
MDSCLLAPEQGARLRILGSLTFPNLFTEGRYFMPAHQGKYGIRDFTKPTTATNPKQPCNLPHEGDPFCGNDNNRRAVFAKIREEAKANPDAFDADAAVAALGGVERLKKAIAGHPQFKDMSDEPAPESTNFDQDADPNAQEGSEGVSQAGSDSEEAKTETKAVKPPKPPAGSAPAWKANA